MSRYKPRGPPSWTRFPRVSGDEPIRHERGQALGRFSPRERG